MRAERIRAGGLSRLWTVMMPAAVVLPTVITLGIAGVAESFARIPGQISVLQVSTSNAGYWVITIAVVVTAVAAADGQGSEKRYCAAEHVRLSVPRTWPVLLGRWIFYGVVGMAVAVATLVVVLAALPVVSPHVYGAVSATDAVAIRLVWTLAVLTFFAAGAGTGIGALVESPLAAAGLILLWVYAFESAAGYLPSGAWLQRFMPMMNAVYATGQDAILVPPWNENTALIYVCALFSVIFLIATIERTFRHG
ncbi:MAG: ABC transporter permease [Actinomycetota bacterium]|nr:ABC transporter permease [Actinomycetota bacterium]